MSQFEECKVKTTQIGNDLFVAVWHTGMSLGGSLENGNFRKFRKILEKGN